MSWPNGSRSQGEVKRFDVTLEGLRQLHQRVGEQRLEPDDWPFLGALVCKQIARAERMQERMVAKIAAAAGQEAQGPLPDADGSVKADEPSSSSSPDPNATSSDEAESAAGGGDGGSNDGGSREAEPAVPTNVPKGHGRNGAGAFTGAKHFCHPLAAGVIGAVCTRCGFNQVHGYREKVTIRIIGQPLFGAEAHHFGQARCRNCGHIVRADGPSIIHEGLGSEYVRYDWSACGMLIVMHYFGGGPFKRLESLHQGWGVPMPDANQWEIVNGSDDLLLPLYKALEYYAIRRATNFRIDDTGSMVIAMRKQIEAEIAALQQLGESTKDVRTGINATGVYWETPDGPIILFYTGRHHAGEIVDRLLRHRLLSEPKLVKCTDGASKNFDHTQQDKLVEATCNAHALLKFDAIKDKYPAEYATAGRIYQQVFDHDDGAEALGLNPVQRMLYHRQHSKPLMEELKKMCKEKLESKLVEPNSPLWEPLSFVINQWDRLTRFYHVPGVPLDSNRVEQALIMPVRYMAGSFNYQTQDGAVVGDHHMSLIATARANGVEPVAYLAECLRCHDDLANRPEHYLPWVYRERLKQQTSPPPSTPQRPPDAQATTPQPSRHFAP